MNVEYAKGGIRRKNQKSFQNKKILLKENRKNRRPGNKQRRGEIRQNRTLKIRTRIKMRRNK